MKPEMLRDWLALLGLSGMVGTVLALVAKAIIERKSLNHEHRWQDEKERRGRSEETDRATYNQRITVLVREPLAAFIRTGEWAGDEGELRRLLASLSQRTYEHFLDRDVNRAWEILVAKSVDVASRRLSSRAREQDIREYNRLRADWEDACKRSFGPLPLPPEEAVSPQEPREAAS